MNEQIPESLKQEAEREYPFIEDTCVEDYRHNKMQLSLRSAYIADVLSRSGGVWVKEDIDKIQCLIGYLEYWLKNQLLMPSPPQELESVVNEANQWVKSLSESLAADKGDAIEFAEWIMKSEYEVVWYKGEYLRWCILEVAEFGSASESDYLTTQQLYNLYREQHQPIKKEEI